MGEPIAERAEVTDKDRPRLERYDRWGHEVSRVVMPPSFEASKADLLANAFDRPVPAGGDGGRRQPRPLSAAWIYLLCQAEIGMYCALGTGGDMVVDLAERFAPDDVRDRVRELMTGEPLAGEASQMLTERSGGSDLAMLETTATPAGDDSFLLNGFKWFASNANGSAFVVLAKPEGAADGVRGVAPFLVLWERAGRVPQRHPHPAAEGQARHPRRRLGRGGAGRLRGRSCWRPAAARRRRSRPRRRRQGPGPDDVDDQRVPARHRHDGPRRRPGGRWSSRSATRRPAKRSAPASTSSR